MTTTETNVQVLARAMKAFGDPAARDSYFDLYDEAIVLRGYDGVGEGLTNVKSFYAALWEAFPDAGLTAADVFAEGDRVACRFVMTAHHLGPFQGIPPTGRKIVLPGITILRFENGKCVERWSQADFLGLLKQLGVMG